MRITRFLGICTLLCLSTAAPITAFAERPVLGVAEFTNDTRSAYWWRHDVGRDLSAMLANELAATGAFSVVERSRLEHVMREQDLGASGRIRHDTAAQIGELTGAQYIVMGTVTSYTEDTSRTGGGGSIGNIKTPKLLRKLPGIGSRSRIGGGGEVKEAYVAVDLRVVDSTTGELSYVRTIEGHTRDSSMRFRGSTGHLSGNFFRDEDTPAAQAMRAALIEITDYLECAMVIQGGCLAEYDAKEDRRREETRSKLRL